LGLTNGRWSRPIGGRGGGRRCWGGGRVRRGGRVCVKLSGGELQRVSIARAILRQPKIVLLDEATSMIDAETEAVIQKAFRRLTAGRTTSDLLEDGQASLLWWGGFEDEGYDCQCDAADG